MLAINLSRRELPQPKVLSQLTRKQSLAWQVEERPKETYSKLRVWRGSWRPKKTADLIPLCHPLGLDAVEIEFSFTSPDELRIVATASLTAKTGVEMEALTAVSIAALTVYDMCKSIDKAMTIGPIRLLSKTGGKSGNWSAPL